MHLAMESTDIISIYLTQDVTALRLPRPQQQLRISPFRTILYEMSVHMTVTDLGSLRVGHEV